MRKFNVILKAIEGVVPNFIESNKDVFDELERRFVDNQQADIRKNPSVFISINTDKKTDRKYITAKTFWPMVGRKDKEIRIYVGRLADFPNGITNPRCKEIAKSKMISYLDSL